MSFLRGAATSFVAVILLVFPIVNQCFLSTSHSKLSSASRSGILFAVATAAPKPAVEVKPPVVPNKAGAAAEVDRKAAMGQDKGVGKGKSSSEVVGRQVAGDEQQMFLEEFREYDMNADELLDAHELRAQHSEIEPAELIQFFGNVDADDSGTVSFPEYMDYISLLG